MLLRRRCEPPPWPPCPVPADDDGLVDEDDADEEVAEDDITPAAA